MMAQFLLQRLVDPITRNWFIHLSGSVGRLALGMISSVLLARAMGPEIFGVYVLLGSTGSIMGAAANMGLARAGVKQVAAIWENDPHIARQRGHVFFVLQVVGATAILLIILSFTPFVADDLLQVDRILFVLLAIGVLATVLSGTMNSLLQATGQFGRLSLNLLLNSGLTSLLAILLFWRGQLNLINALLILGVVTSLVSFTAGYLFLPQTMKFDRQPLAWQAEGRALFRLSRWFWLSSLFTILATRTDIILVSRLLDNSTAGFYGLAANLTAKADLINHSLYAVLLPAAAAIGHRDRLRPYVTRALRRSLLVCLGLLLLLTLAQPLIIFLYGQDYAAAVPFFRWLLVLVMFDIFTTPLLLLAFPFERPQLLTLNDALRLAIFVPLVFWFIPGYEAMGVIIAKFVSQIVAIGFTLALLWHKRPQVADLT
jgi:O-antigen/teichoic acid export membrane protein